MSAINLTNLDLSNILLIELGTLGQASYEARNHLKQHQESGHGQSNKPIFLDDSSFRTGDNPCTKPYHG